jgi:ATP-binding cassette subfamily B protein
MNRLNEVHALDNEDNLGNSFDTKLLLETKINSSKNYTKIRKLSSNFLVQKKNIKTHSIKFQGVSYTYPGAGNTPVLNNINLELPFGKTTAIVGMSGSGKTTLLKLLLKYYQPQSGNIFINQIPLTDITHSSWRSQCGVVMQDSYIFPDTIGRNIALGEDKPDEVRLIDATNIANIYNFIKNLPGGFDTKIGIEGHGISAGQRQRILIARAVYRNPEFIFLDEATNSLDTDNELLIQNNLLQFFVGKTVIVVAHRLSTVKKADQIVLLNQGFVTESGTHDELINKRNEYFRLIKNQLELIK